MKYYYKDFDGTLSIAKHADVFTEVNGSATLVFGPIFPGGPIGPNYFTSSVCGLGGSDTFNIIEGDEIAAIMPQLRAERDGLRADLAAEEPSPMVIEFRPRAVDKFRRHIEQLVEIAQPHAW